jgi:hypothetical protein
MVFTLVFCSTKCYSGIDSKRLGETKNVSRFFLAFENQSRVWFYLKNLPLEETVNSRVHACEIYVQGYHLWVVFLFRLRFYSKSKHLQWVFVLICRDGVLGHQFKKN